MGVYEASCEVHWKPESGRLGGVEVRLRCQGRVSHGCGVCGVDLGLRFIVEYREMCVEYLSFCLFTRLGYLLSSSTLGAFRHKLRLVWLRLITYQQSTIYHHG